jgi:penicillin G amidase
VKRKALRVVLVLLFVTFIVAAGSALWVRGQLRASLPLLDGTIEVAGLSAPVRIERDELGVPTITAASRSDLSFATGWLHAQERFFQMDLMRRSAAGELSELFGTIAVETDKRARIHRFRHRARRALELAAPQDRDIVEAYARGVNSGLAALRAAPFEYLLLRRQPAPWRPEDGFLVLYAMYLQLQDPNGRAESNLGVMRDTLPPEVLAFLAPLGTDWDAAIDGTTFAPAPLPGPETFDLRSQVPAKEGVERPSDLADERIGAGSNNWAVAGTHTSHGGAILADDMHLGLAVPTVWYRASFVWQDEDEQRRITGVTLPGTAIMVVGSNGHIAWGFTNTQGDWVDLVVLEPVPGDPDAYLTPDGPRPFETITEVIAVAGGEPQTLEIRETIWGPVIGTDHLGRERASCWVAYRPEGANLGILWLESADSIGEALQIAGAAGMPHQNLMLADSGGRIAWTVIGRIPRRVGFSGRFPESWADGSRSWDGWLEPEDYPRVVNPEGGRLWSANNRVVGGDMLNSIGYGSYVLGARAGQIRDDLLALDSASEADLLAVQLDDRALFLQRWRDLLLEVLDSDEEPTPIRREMRRLVESWGGRAAIDSAGYRLVRAWRLIVTEQVAEMVTLVCRQADEDFDYRRIPHIEQPIWQLVTERPEHLLARDRGSWQQLLLRAVDETAEQMLATAPTLSEATWGARNTTRIQHPLSQAIPALSRWLDMPARPLPGGSRMPRVQHPDWGASERMVVSPGREEHAILHIPCGQSGHPLSPHYRDSHQAWEEGEATPFLPGPPVHVLELQPEQKSASKVAMAS